MFPRELEQLSKESPWDYLYISQTNIGTEGLLAWGEYVCTGANWDSQLEKNPGCSFPLLPYLETMFSSEQERTGIFTFFSYLAFLPLKTDTSRKNNPIGLGTFFY